MNNFVLKELCTSDLKKELSDIGFDKAYIHKASEKYEYKNIKIFDLTIAQANILKQTALALGADCAIHREVITAKIEKTDCILGASISTLRKISQKLKLQPFKLKELAELIENNIDFKLQPIQIKDAIFNFEKPYIVGVLNITKDSFSDGGEFFEIENTKRKLLELVEEGADIIELGAESTRPFSKGTDAELQIEKLLPVLEFIKEEKIKTPISIDTRSAKVAKACVEAGANIINDVSGFDYDPDMLQTLVQLNVPVIIQHSKGSPEKMQIEPEYNNLMDEIFLSLYNKIQNAKEAGIKPENLIVDPGIGFGKTNEHNFEIIKRFEELYFLNCPVMIGLSRKSILKMKEETNETKDIFSLALNAIIAQKKVNFIRVHNVSLHRKLVDLLFS